MAIFDEDFALLEPWSGTVPPGYTADAFGMRYPVDWAMRSATRLREAAQARQERVVTQSFPHPTNGGYYEFGALIRVARHARDRFTMIELGAGFGPNLIRATLILRRLDPMPVRLIGVEGERMRHEWMRRHFGDHGLDPDAHTLIRAAVVGDSREEPTVLFPQGEADHPGRSIVRMREGARSEEIMARIEGGEPVGMEIDPTIYYRGRTVAVEKMEAVSLHDLTPDLDRIDCLHMDVQAEELAVVQGAREIIGAKVACLNIGTHSSEIEDGLRETLGEMGWRCLVDLSRDQETTLDGHVVNLRGQDGFQYWENPALLDGR